MEQKNSILNSKLIEHLEVKGFCIIENVLNAKNLENIKNELTRLEISYKKNYENNLKKDYVIESDRFMAHDLQFEDCPTVLKLIGSGKVYEFISKVTGDNLICIGCTYSNCKPGYSGIPAHTDYDPYDNKILRPSNPIALRALFYLDNIELDKAPLKVLPGSHIKLHNSMRYDMQFNEALVDEEIITCKAGTVVIINTKIFHGVLANSTSYPRRVLAISYRPYWAAPLIQVKEHNNSLIAKLPNEIKPLFDSLNCGNQKRTDVYN